MHKYYPEDDPDPLEIGVHAAGNKLAVAFRLLAEGGTNPVCSEPAVNNCNLDVQGIGLDDAAKVFHYMAQYYVTNATDWPELADMAHWAANALFWSPNPCNCAYDEQQAAADAFEAIGYPPQHTPIYCWCDVDPPQ
jgi:hypothetical protein